VRKGIIGQVLATDMARHGDYVKRLADLSETPNPKLGESKELLLEAILHASDISNPAKPRQQMLRWTRLVNLEFWAQGDEERRLGVDVSPLCDREAGKAGLPAGQIGFITFMVLPYYKHMGAVLIECQEAAEGLDKNISFWKEMKEQGKTYDEIYADFEQVETPAMTSEKWPSFLARPKEEDDAV